MEKRLNSNLLKASFLSIISYISAEERKASDLYPLKKMVEYFKFQKLIRRYDDLYSVDMFGESLEGHKHMNPYADFDGGEVIINTHVDEDKEILSKVPTIKGFEDLDGIE
ncbi:hypothetical protein HMPREF0984_00827 [Eubacterium sp. 3_1_31]|nr:hypothetical protein HMPREF0984_00827 [Eubacterium sp. 3_1_31]